MKKNLLLIFFSLLLVSVTSYAQTAADMEKMITTIVEQNKVGHSKANVDKMMNHFRADVMINVSRISVDGKRYHRVLRKNDYRSLFITQYNQGVHRESEVKIHSSQVQGEVGVTIFTLNYTLLNDENGKVLSKGIEYITATFIAEDKKWSVLELSITDIEQEQFQGKCSCEIYSNPNTGSVIAKVGAPKGDRFENELNNLYSKQIDGQTFFMVQGVIFQWFGKKELWTVDASYDKIEKLGAAKNKKTAMKLLMMYLYKDECSDMDMIF